MIVLMRHAEVEGGEGRCAGRFPLHLSPEGRARALHVAEELADAPFARLCASPASRTQETLGPLAERTGLPVDILPELDEIDMGVWDGRLFAELKTCCPDQYAARGQRLGHFRVPGGESFADVADRAMRTLSVLAEGAQPTLVATHAGVIMAVLCRVTGHPLDDLFRFRPGHCRCAVLAPEDGGFRVVAEDAAPLEAAALL